MLMLRDVSLRAPDGWSGHQCSVPIEHITVVEPQLDQSMVLQAIYDLGKQLLVEKNNNDALTYLESLEDEPEHAMNAALLISVIYQSMNTELAELVQDNETLDSDTIIPVEQILSTTEILDSISATLSHFFFFMIVVK